jgi:hypothetical protein
VKFEKIHPPIAQKELALFAMEPYHQFIHKYMNEPLVYNAQACFAWFSERFKHLGLVFYGLNSANILSHSKPPEACAPLEMMREITKNVRRLVNGAYPHLYVVGLGHHNILTHSEGGGISNHLEIESYLKRTDYSRPNLYMHGHNHEPDFEKKFLNCAGDTECEIIRSQTSTLSLQKSARRDDTLRGFNMITLHRRDSMVEKAECTSVTIDQQGLKATQPKIYERHFIA